MTSNESSSDFSLLPPHVIAQIFTLLKFRQRLSAAQTCKTWYFASCDPIIWKNTRVRINHKVNRLDELQRPFGTLVMQRINFNQFVYHQEFFARFGKYIRELQFDHCDISFQQLINCLILTPSLKSLTIVANNEMFTSAVDLSSEQAAAIETNLKHLKNFEISLNTPNCERLGYIMRMMPNLAFLNFNNSDYCYDYTYKSFFEYINTFRGEINFQRLSIGNLFLQNSVKFFNDFSKISQNLNVYELVLGKVNGDWFDENTVKFGHVCKKLSNVRMLSMCSIEQNQLYDVCQYMKQLTGIHLWAMCIQRIKCIGSLRNLQKLTLLSSLYHMANEDELLGMIYKLHKLTELRLDSAYIITKPVLNAICLTCTNLTRLELPRLETNNLSILFKNLTKLKVLHLSYGQLELNFSGSVDCDITNLKFLEELVINSFQPGMTIELIEKLPNLRPESLLKIRTSLQVGYVDPVLEDAFEMVSGLFD